MNTIPAKAITGYSRQGNFRQYQAKRFDINKFQTIPGRHFRPSTANPDKGRQSKANPGNATLGISRQGKSR